MASSQKNSASRAYGEHGAVAWGSCGEAKVLSLMAGWGCHYQYKASCSRHFILEDAQERQDKEVFQQNMKRRLESFKSTKHNICFTKSKPRPRKAGCKKACALLGLSFGARG